jgi:hypothetical protein
MSRSISVRLCPMTLDADSIQGFGEREWKMQSLHRISRRTGPRTMDLLRQVPGTMPRDFRLTSGNGRLKHVKAESDFVLAEPYG